MDGPAVLIILDGWGEAVPSPGNAVALARTPVFDRVRRDVPFTTICAAGSAVGLPDGQIGNSEVGHLTIGAGRVVPMDLPRIDAAVARGELSTNPALGRFLASTAGAGGTVHLAGLASNGGVHSHIGHIAALAACIAVENIPVRLHLFLDGRDVIPGTAAGHIRSLAARLGRLPDCRIATISGRYFAMDRDKRWERTERAWRAIALGQGIPAASPDVVADGLRESAESEEFLPPAVIEGYGGIRECDGFLSANFRVDRMRQLFAAIALSGFNDFDIGAFETPRALASATPLSVDLDPGVEILFPAQRVHATLGSHLSRAGRKQLRIAETEKYPHVTYFLNGGVEPPDCGEERFLVPSPKVATYDLAPEMSARAIGDRLVRGICERRHDVIIVNFANPDMVGHTGDLAAVIRAVETVDLELGRALDSLLEARGVAIVTADHGNAEQMADPETGKPHTAHTTNPVPFAVVGLSGTSATTRIRKGGLADIAPSLLRLMGIPPPPEMSGRPLLLPE